MAGELHGIRACVFVDGAKLPEAYGYNIGWAGDVCEVLRFEDTWKVAHPGGKSGSGNLTAYHNQGAKILATLAQARMAYPMLIYPDCADVLTYYQFEALFDFEASGDVGSCQVQSAPFRVVEEVTKVGFA